MVLATYLPMITPRNMLTVETNKFGEVCISFCDGVYWVDGQTTYFRERFNTLPEVADFCGPVSKIEIMDENEEVNTLYSASKRKFEE